MNNTCLIVLIVVCFAIIGFGLIVSAFDAADIDLGVGIHVVFLAFLLLCFLLVTWSYRLQWLREQNKQYCTCICLRRQDGLSPEEKAKYGIKQKYRNRQLLLECTGFPMLIRKARRAIELEGGAESCHRAATEEHQIPQIPPFTVENFSKRIRELDSTDEDLGLKTSNAVKVNVDKTSSSTSDRMNGGRGPLLIEEYHQRPPRGKTGLPLLNPSQLLHHHHQHNNQPTTTAQKHSSQSSRGRAGRGGGSVLSSSIVENNRLLSSNGSLTNVSVSVAHSSSGGCHGRRVGGSKPGRGGRGAAVLQPPSTCRLERRSGGSGRAAPRKKYVVKNSFANPNRYLHSSSSNSSSMMMNARLTNNNNNTSSNLNTTNYNNRPPARKISGTKNNHKVVKQSNYNSSKTNLRISSSAKNTTNRLPSSQSFPQQQQQQQQQQRPQQAVHKKDLQILRQSPSGLSISQSSNVFHKPHHQIDHLIKTTDLPNQINNSPFPPNNNNDNVLVISTFSNPQIPSSIQQQQQQQSSPAKVHQHRNSNSLKSSHIPPNFSSTGTPQQSIKILGSPKLPPEALGGIGEEEPLLAARLQQHDEQPAIHGTRNSDKFERDSRLSDQVTVRLLINSSSSSSNLEMLAEEAESD